MILITGAGGTVGTAVVKELRAAGHSPREAYHSPQKAKDARENGRDAVALDFTSPATLEPALAGIDRLFLLGTGVRGQAEAEAAVVTAARIASVGQVVKLSVFGAADEQSVLARIHRSVEQAIEASGMAWTFLRPNGFMQNFINYMGHSIRSQSAFYQPAADARISHIDVRDIARVAARVLTATGHDGQAYELTGAQAFSYEEAADTLSRATGRRITYVPVSDDAARAGMLAAGMPDFYADALVDLNRHFRTGAGAKVTTAVRDITGLAPATFEEFVRDHVDSFKALSPHTTVA